MAADAPAKTPGTTAAAAGPTSARRLAPESLGRRMLHSPRIVVSLVFLGLIGLVSLAAPVVAPQDPTQMAARPLLSPGGQYLLGTDDFGRDALSRLIFAGRVSLGVSVASVVMATFVGVWLGLMAGYFGGWADTLIMRAMDLLLSFPTIVLAIAIVAMLGASLTNLIFVIAIVYVPRFVRIVYGATLSVRELEYVQAARVAGAGDFRILRRSILPNVLTPIMVQFSLSLGFAILVETGLSFLGLGAQPPTPSWGNMVAAARPTMETHVWLLLAPAGAVGLTILMLNTLGDGLRDLLDPRMARN
ncbi:MAG: ABC transporter permease [Chloroflexi bacterium]|nr:ABC transporter permease [Chloroflexota bacterium]